MINTENVQFHEKSERKNLMVEEIIYLAAAWSDDGYIQRFKDFLADEDPQTIQDVLDIPDEVMNGFLAEQANEEDEDIEIISSWLEGNFKLGFIVKVSYPRNAFRVHKLIYVESLDEMWSK